MIIILDFFLVNCRYLTCLFSSYFKIFVCLVGNSSLLVQYFYKKTHNIHKYIVQYKHVIFYKYEDKPKKYSLEYNNTKTI